MERNVELLEKTMQHIMDHPEDHNQAAYFTECGTPSCFAGWAIHLSGRTAKHEAWPTTSLMSCWEEGNCWEEGLSAPGMFAAKLLGLDVSDAALLFNAVNTRETLALMVKDLVNGDDLKPPQYPTYREALARMGAES